MNKLNTIIKAIKGGKSQFDKILKANQNLKDLRLDTYLANGQYCLDIREYYETNKKDLKKSFTYKEWFEENFSNVLFSYTLATKYIKLYEFENKENKFKGHKRKLLRENNFNSLNESLNYIRGNKQKTTIKAKKNNNDIVFVFSVGDSSNKYKIEKNKRGEFIYYLDNKLIEPSKIKVVHEELITLMASLNIYQHEEIPEINS
jgi:hypothetical protein